MGIKSKRLVPFAAALFGIAVINLVEVLPGYQWYIIGGAAAFALALLAASYWPPLWRKR